MLPLLPDSNKWRRDLKERRQERGYSVRQLAELLEVNPAYISLVESGTKIPNEETAERWAEALGMDPGIFLAWVRSWREQDPARASESYAEYQTLSANPNAEVRVARSDQVSFRSTEREREAGREDKVPLLPEGTDPDSNPEPLDYLSVDPDLLASLEKLVRPFGYRLSAKGVQRVWKTLRPGDYVIVTRKPEPPIPKEIYAVKLEGKIVLSRLLTKGPRMLLLLSDAGEEQIEPVLVSAGDVRSLIVGKVAVAIRPWQYTVISPGGGASK